ncbi:hypothetical protein [Clostridium saccharoperbutylacetonicum]|uniref:hypothetical protein n=1 Tax=Clostridium saccharoperbutylacetonicum TaxID=36745 RepID=UPI000983F02A|nr:hypothetical protein [Clostridium saccharoperbutylacetonicum]AQR94341.1 hypothetical protein CLSAP_16480 [Clostridium saccharoperbutylacetonicum]NSB30040.1 hypothetical protein [Clostridium saccharoperbutylacetonicum]
MNRKIKFILFALVIFLLVVIGILKFNFSSGYKISIANNTNKTIENLELRYKVGDIIQNISQIESKKSWKGAIDTNSIQGENAIILTYKNNKGTSYEEYVVGYLEKGYSGKADVVINKIDENGKLEMEVK